MKKSRFLLIMFCAAMLVSCKDFKTVAPSQPKSSQPAATGSQASAEGATAQSTPAPSADTAPEEKRLAGEPPQVSDPAVRKGSLLFSSSLLGSRVKDAKGNDVGEIKDLLFDPENKQVVFAILSLSNRDIAVPLSAIKMDPQSQTYTLESTEETVAGAPKTSNDTKPSSEPATTTREDMASSSSPGEQPNKLVQ